MWQAKGLASEQSWDGKLLEIWGNVDHQSDGCHGPWMMMEGKPQMAGATFGQGKSGPSPTRRSAHSEFPKPIHLDAGYYKVGKVHDMG
ncbi:hypothetical protein E4U35_001009 [Claviceps purpurea]|nr:hypothetical protein E4U51_000091 [Claviceps purpurea]KAG6207396.1 hypothetical protein E4U35_001009 [Claviceps purpurea]